MTLIEIKNFNQKVGVVLRSNRDRLGLSREEVANQVEDLSAWDLRQIENGEKSIRCDTVYKLFENVYSPTQDEILFFCCLSRESIQKSPSPSPTSPSPI